jgi:hypothetical protein
MNAEPSRSTSEPAAATGAPADAADPSLLVTTIPARAPLWVLALGAGLVSGLICWAGGEAIYPAFHFKDEVIYPANYKTLSGYRKEGVDAMIQSQAQRIVERKKAAASFGLLGLVLAAGLGLIGGGAAGSPRRAGLGAVGGGLAGALAGAGLSWAAVPLFFRYLEPESGFTILFLTHAAIFIGIGGASGLGLGLGLGDGRSLVTGLLGGLLGGFLGTVTLETVDSLAFPLMRTFEPIASERIPRAVMYLCLAAVTALVAGLAAGKRADFPQGLAAKGKQVSPSP